MPSNPLPVHVTKRYDFISTIGSGAYGNVYKCRDRQTGREIAIKHLAGLMTDRIKARRALREILLLSHLNGNDNVIRLHDIEIPPVKDYTDVYVVLELMETDLHAIIRSGQPLTDQHYQYFIYQLVRGLKWVHSAGIIHRDLKPGNLLVNSDCELKICDFGLARQVRNQDLGFMTEYVATRWYRAPEVMMTSGEYTQAMDMWSVGVILAELIAGKTFFKGKNYLDTLTQIMSVLGTPDDATLDRIIKPHPDQHTSSRIRKYLKTIKKMPRVPLAEKFPQANPKAIDLMEKLLVWCPTDRLSAAEVLAHPYLADYHAEDDEPLCPSEISMPFDSVLQTKTQFTVEEQDEIRRYITETVTNFKMGQMRLHAVKMQGGMKSPTSAGAGKLISKADQPADRDDLDEDFEGPDGVEAELRREGIGAAEQ